MSRLSPEVTKKQFPAGTIVQIDQTMLNRWTAEASTKMKNRIGEVVYFDEERNQLGVTFAAIGRRPCYKTRLYADETLLKVTDAAEISAWRQQVAAKEKARAEYASRMEKAELALA